MMITMKRFVLVVAIVGLVHLDIAYSQSPSMPGSKIVIQDAGEILGFALDRQTLATRGRDKKIHFGDVSTGRQVRTLSLDIGRWTIAKLSPDGATVWTEKVSGKTAKLWDAQTGKLKATIEVNDETFIPIFSLDGRTVATTGNDGRAAIIWDIETGQLKATLTHRDKLPWFFNKPMPVAAEAFTPDSQGLITVFAQAIYVWNLRNNSLVGRLFDPSLTSDLRKDFWVDYSEIAHRSTIYNIAVSPNGKLLASASRDGTAKLWNLEKLELKATLFTLKRNVVVRVNFSPDSHVLAVTSEDRTVRLFDTMTAKQLAVLEHRGTPWSVDFSPDGRLIATGADKDHSIKIWDGGTGKLLSELKDARYPAIFSPDGRTLVTGGEKNTVLLWNIPEK